MKTILCAALALIAFSGSAEAQYFRVGPDIVKGKPTPEEQDSLPSSRGDIMRGPRVNEPGSIVAVACAPEVVSGNVAATDRTLKTLAAMPEFKDAKTFRKEVIAISKMKSSADKASKYFALVGVDASNSQEVLEFVGARDVKGKHLIALEKNADLSASQAEIVATKLQSNLRGGLQ